MKKFLKIIFHKLYSLNFFSQIKILEKNYKNQTNFMLKIKIIIKIISIRVKEYINNKI